MGDVRLAPNEIGELVPEFTVMLQATNRSPRTIETYLRGVHGLDVFLRERGMPTAVDVIAREHIEAHFAELLDRGYKAASAKAWYDGIRQFFAWCEEEGEVQDGRNPMRHVRPPKVIANPPDVLHEDQVRALLATADSRVFEDRRDAALIALMYDTGLRLAECAGLRIDDLDIVDRREVRVLGKGRKERVVPMGANAARALGRYLRMRRQHREAGLRCCGSAQEDR
jgi:site-specific recombinase XerD